jgi:hypothetical protein
MQKKPSPEGAAGFLVDANRADILGYQPPEARTLSRQFSVGTCPFTTYSGEGDQGSGVMPISVPVDSDQVIGAERRWQGDCVG